MKKTYLFLFSLLVIVYSCKRDTSLPLSQQELAISLENSASFNKFMLFNARMKRAVVAGEFNLTNETTSKVNAIIATNKTESLSQIEADLTKAGMTNAKKYLFLSINRRHYLALLKKEFPQLATMDPKNLYNVVNKVYYSSKAHKEPSTLKLITLRKTNIQKLKTTQNEIK